MPESSLSIGLPELQEEVGGYLGYGRTAADWTTDQASLVDSRIQAGVRQVYYPPALDGQERGHGWSFLRPSTTLTLTEDTGDYNMPDDFGRLVGDLHFAADKYRSSIKEIAVGDILDMRSNSSSVSGTSRYAATRYKAADGTAGQRQEILFYPTPDDDYVLSYEYEAYNGKLTDAAPYPLGGMQYAELYISSCLAVAERRDNDEVGIHNQDFTRLLADAISRDRKHGAKNFGQMGDHESDSTTKRYRYSDYPITYHGTTY